MSKKRTLLVPHWQQMVKDLNGGESCEYLSFSKSFKWSSCLTRCYGILRHTANEHRALVIVFSLTEQLFGPGADFPQESKRLLNA